MKKRLIGSLLFGALIVSSSSVFVSCADYDDDINANKAEIQAVQTELNKLTSDLTALQTQLTSTKNDLQNELTAAKSEFETKIAAAKAELQDAINTKADQSTVDALSTKLANLETAYTAKVASLEAQIAQINASLDAINNLIAQKADKSELTAAIATLQAAIDKKVDTETYNQAVALLQELKTNLSNLQTLVDTKASKEYVDGEVTKLNATITALQAALEGKVATTEFAALKSTVDAIQDAVKALQTAAANAATKDELNSVKSELNAAIAKLQEQINGYVTTEKLESAINTLKIELQAAIDALKEGKADKADVAAMAVQIAGLEAVVANMLTQSDLDLLREQLTQLINTKDTAINEKVDGLFAALTLAIAANEEASENADAELAAAIAALEASTNQSVANLQDKDAALQALIDALTANAANLQSQIDDLKANKADKAALDAAVADLTEAKTNISLALAAIAGITGDIETINANYAALIAQIANTDAATDASIAALNTKIEGLENGKVAANAAAIIALQVQNNAIAAFLGELTEGGLAGQLEALKQAMSAEAQAKLNAEIADRVAAINEVVGKINEVKSDLASLDSKLYDAENGDITKLKAQFATIDQKIQDAIDENLAALKLYIQRMLSSVTLIPKLYVGGIEAIQFESVQYLEVEQCNNNGVHGNVNHAWNAPGQVSVDVEPLSTTQSTFKVFGWTHIKNTTWRYLGNEEAEAWYRVSPAHLDAAAFIKEEIEVVANKALTRVAEPLTQSPVEVIKNRTFYNPEEGIVKIYLKKTDAFQGKDLNSYGLNTGEGEIYTVSLRVPRSADYMPTDADGEAIAKYVYSEFSRLDEVKIRPYIAEKFDADGKHNYQWRYNTNYHHDYYSNYTTNKAAGVTPYGDRAGWGPVHRMANQSAAYNGNATQHFLDSATIFRSAVDADEYVKVKILYSLDGDKQFCLNDVVTGCYDPSVRRTVNEKIDPNGKHQQITADRLKQFGLAFRFGIPTTYYGIYDIQEVDHVTNQNKFAAVRYNANNGKTYIRSTYVTANGQAKIDARNAACVGKEPIVRIELRDTVNNRLVDQRYMKIKWIENTLEPVQLADEESFAYLSCNDMVAKYTWSEFINKVYAAAIENEGMSQTTFESIYPWANIDYNNFSGFDWDVVAPNPDFKWTNNLQGDALIGTWTLTPDDVRRVYKGGQDDSRTFTCRVYFRSVSKTEHPDLWFNWKFTIKVPTLPAINGFYNNYWLDESTHSLHYVLPVQYGTAQYKKLGAGVIAYAAQPDVQDAHPTVAPTPDGFVPGYDPANNNVDPGTKYCVFDNNLMNAFTYEVGNNTLFIVKNILNLKQNAQKNMGIAYGEEKTITNNETQYIDYGCRTWDIQFRQQQKENGYHSGYYATGYNTGAWNDGFKVAAGVDYIAGQPSNANNGILDREPDVVMADQDAGYWLGQANNASGRKTAQANNTYATVNYDDKTPNTTPAYKLYKDGKNANVLSNVNQNANTLAARLVWLDGHKQWDGNINQKSANLVVDHIDWNAGTPNTSMVDLLNPLQKGNEADGWTPLKTNDKQIRMAVWATLNRWNHVPVWFYNIALVAPLRLNATLDGVFEDGWVSGTAVEYDRALTLTDFRGYKVTKDAPAANETLEQNKYTDRLYKYYEVRDPEWDTDNTTYGLDYVNGQIVRDDTKRMTSARLKQLTNGNIDLSIKKGTSINGKPALIFKNNGGSNVETTVKVFIPVSLKYGFGTLRPTDGECEVTLYKKGTAPDQSKVITGVDAGSRQK